MSRYDYTLEVGPEEWVNALNDNQFAIVYIYKDDEGAWRISVSVRPGLSPDTEANICEGVDNMIDQLIDIGDPERIGWYPSELNPGQWYQVIAFYLLPDMDDL